MYTPTELERLLCQEGARFFPSEHYNFDARLDLQLSGYRIVVVHKLTRMQINSFLDINVTDGVYDISQKIRQAFESTNLTLERAILIENPEFQPAAPDFLPVSEEVLALFVLLDLHLTRHRRPNNGENVAYVVKKGEYAYPIPSDMPLYDLAIWGEFLATVREVHRNIPTTS